MIDVVHANSVHVFFPLSTVTFIFIIVYLHLPLFVYNSENLSPCFWFFSPLQDCKREKQNQDIEITYILTEEITFGFLPDCGGTDYCSHKIVCGWINN